jgi:hypothetical protein
MILLTSDWHLDSDPANAYRWLVWQAVREQIRTGCNQIYMVGDLCEHKDKHAATMVNGILDEITMTVELGKDLYGDDFLLIFLLGNHDKPLKGDPFWNLINYLNGPVLFLVEPTLLANGEALFLPHSDDPATEWADIDFESPRAVFLHQTLPGAKAEGMGHREMDGLAGIPIFPKHLKVYSGDIHLPQIVNRGAAVEYVGAPHLVRFGDDHRTRMLRLDPVDYSIIDEIILDAPRKTIAEIKSTEELQKLSVKRGDKIRVRFTIPHDKIEQWSVEETEIKRWAAERGIEIASIEPIIEAIQYTEHDAPIVGFDQDPRTILDLFAQEEGIDEGLWQAGTALLKGELS